MSGPVSDRSGGPAAASDPIVRALVAAVDRSVLAAEAARRLRARTRYRRDRDVGALESSMSALDAEEADVGQRGAPRALSAAEVVEYLRDLARLWDDAPTSRRGLAEALFARIDVLGLRRMRIQPTPAAASAGIVEAFARTDVVYGRGERIRASARREIRGCAILIEADHDPLDLVRTA